MHEYIIVYFTTLNKEFHLIFTFFKCQDSEYSESIAILSIFVQCYESLLGMGLWLYYDYFSHK